MHLFHQFRALFCRSKLDREMDDELRFHVEEQTQRNLAAGMSPDEAALAARKQFGWRERIREEVREQRGGARLEDTLRDVRYALRTLRKNPGFAFTAVLTLALGIGATTTMFTVVDTVMWRPLPYAEPERLVVSSSSLQAFQEWRDEQRVMDRVEIHAQRTMILTSATSEPAQLGVDAVSPGMFDLLGRPPMLGRPFNAADGESGNTHVAILSHAFWQQHFGGDRDAVGKQLTLDDETYTVVGVMPHGFVFPRSQFRIWIPLSPTPTSESALRSRVEIVGRVHAGITLAVAQDAVKALNKQLDAIKPQSRAWNIQLSPLDQFRANPGPRKAMMLFLGAVGLLLMIACTNVANLLLVRASVRQREFAVRAALGANRRRLVCQLLTESMILAVLGAAGGLLIAQWGAKVIWLFAPTELTFLSVNEVSVDARVLAFTAGLAGLTTLLCGIVPALRASHSDPNQAMSATTRMASAGPRQHFWQQSFVVAEVALAFVLLVGGGLLMRGFVRMSTIAPGFDTQNILAVSVQLPSARYRSSAQRQDFFERVRERVTALPGVAGVSVATGIKSGSGGFFIEPEIEVEGRAAEKLPDLLPYNVVDGDYFRVMRIPLLRGRAFDRQDAAGAPTSIIINERMARHFWPEADPIGQRLRLSDKLPWFSIVGVVGNTNVMNPSTGMDFSVEKSGFEFYKAASQEGLGGYNTLIVRTDIDPHSLMPAIKSLLWAMDARLPLTSIGTAEELLAATLAVPRFYLLLMTAFGGVAILLAAIGLYGVISYTVVQRTQEIGVRIALGGNSGDIVRLVVQRGLVLAGSGLALGIAVAAGVTRFLESMLFEISALDPMTFVGAASLLITTGALACWFPARRAAKVDPMIALRAE